MTAAFDLETQVIQGAKVMRAVKIKEDAPKRTKFFNGLLVQRKGKVRFETYEEYLNTEGVIV